MVFNLKYLRHSNRWRLDYTLNGERARLNFKSKALAEAHQEQIELQVKQSGAVWTAMSAAERNDIIAVNNEVQAFGLTLRQVWEKFKTLRSAEQPATVTAKFAMDAFIQFLENFPRDEGYVANCRQIITAFIRGRDTRPVNQFTHVEVQVFIDRKSGYKTTVRSRLSAWFNFCLRPARRWVLVNPCTGLDPIGTKYTKRIIFTIKQAKDALEWLLANPRALAWFILSTFVGLRPEEAMQTTWDDISLTEKWVKIEHQTTKLRERRVVPLSDDVVRWLKLAKEKGSLLPMTKKQLSVEQRNMRPVLGVKGWPQDVTRHSAASYMLADAANHGGSSEAVAERLATSEKKLHTNYKAITTPNGVVLTREIAVKFWGLLAKPSKTRQARP